jgi:hypothetical protein
MSRVWKSRTLKSEEEVLGVLLELQGKRWCNRGQPKHYDSLTPSIDRGKLADLPRCEKLRLERRSIDVFRETALFFAEDGERGAIESDLTALMVLRHYDVPTRLVDWSVSPHVAAYFAVCCHDDEDGEIWSFDHDLYAKRGREQWKRFPETTSDGSGDPEKFNYSLPSAFAVEEPPPWVIALFYLPGFHRQRAQKALFTLTPEFGRCHADAITELLGDESACCRYVIERTLKPKLRTILREKHGTWRGSLFPDSAGAADTARTVFPKDRNC